jgi:CBS domain-containing protein
MKIDEQTSVSVIMRGKIGRGQQLVVGLPDYSLDDAQKLFASYDIHHLPVVESLADPKLLGIVSSTDVLRFYFTPKPRGPRDVRLADMMTKDPVTIRPDTAIRDAVSKLAQAAFNSLPVVTSEGRLAGIVTTRDIVRYLNGQYAEDVYQHIQDIVAKATSRVPDPA